MAVTLPTTSDHREVIVDDGSSHDSVATDEDTNRHDCLILPKYSHHIGCVWDKKKLHMSMVLIV